MASITHSSAKNSPNRVFRQPENTGFRFSGCLKAVLLSAAFLTAIPAAAEGITPVRIKAQIQSNGKLGISTRFQTQLPEQLQDALKQGVSLDFALAYRLERPTLASYRLKIEQLLSTDNSVNYRLTFHPLTNRYRVSVGTFSTEYGSLNTALKAVGAIANWQVLNEGALTDTPPENVKAQIRLNLAAGRLPKPFQINALNSKNWDLDSGWHDLEIKP